MCSILLSVAQVLGLQGAAAVKRRQLSECRFLKGHLSFIHN